ncbi:MAG: hypothetical protein SOI26_03740 [Coriobacteriales bacterium]|jgi:hypothetical protein
MLLAGFVLLVALGAGLLFMQGLQACRLRSPRLNLPAAVIAACCAVAGLALYAVMYGNPSRFFGMFRHVTTGIALLLYATVAFVIVAVAYAVVARRREGSDFPRWLGALAVVASVLLVCCATLGYQQSALAKISDRYFVLLAYFLACSLAIGSFAMLALAGALGDEEGMALGRHAALAMTALAALAFGCYLLWFANSGDARVVAQAAKNDMSTTFVIGSAAAQATTVSASQVLADTIAANAALFWAGAVACGLAVPLAAGGAALAAHRRGALLAIGVVGCAALACGMLCFGALLPSLA